MEGKPRAAAANWDSGAGTHQCASRPQRRVDACRHQHALEAARSLVVAPVGHLGKALDGRSLQAGQGTQARQAGKRVLAGLSGWRLVARRYQPARPTPPTYTHTYTSAHLIDRLAGHFTKRC